jgi:hypothetical protein
MRTSRSCSGPSTPAPVQASGSRTRGRRPFVEGIAELQAAEHFRRQGYTIASFDDAKGTESVPDILVNLTDLTAVVEVYCPRAWPGLATYTDAIRDQVKNLDQGVDFEFRIEHQKLEEFGPGMRLLQLHPATTPGFHLSPKIRAMRP